ncbi:WXG100 family type VII secretion target [Cellulomonas sp. DKR-3]|uniref:ESAT-6-like protein n=1 Tax=Cellulomonas fulva TaxID=2835530 RepID=A0ABS5TYM9_9CELL|nr:WXG100 family type VII secretion target [Cellulomonas fulva]MBT0994260.1 WXG100 family type VII secretion target [Cellulomonas fulva]MBT0994262.1 WXG100 family type VII secretion target [Cellulomonas fulva]
MSDLKVNFGGLSTAAADIQAGASQIEGRLNDMDQSLQPLRANWSGEASTSYEAARAKWTSAITDMKALLAEIGTAVSTSNEDYQATERANAARW